MNSILRMSAMMVCCWATGANAQVPTHTYDYVRTHQFTYNGNGTVNTDTVEPGNASSCYVKTYGYDAATGVVNSIQLSQCPNAVAPTSFVARTTAYAHAAMSQLIVVGGTNYTATVAAGIGQTGETNALSQSQSMFDDPRFGVRISSTDVSGLTTTSTLDDFGRVVRTSNVDGTSYVTYYCWLTSAGQPAAQSSNSTKCPTTLSSGEAPAGAAMFMQVELHDTGDVKIGSFGRTYFDRLGRAIRTVTESFDGPFQTAGRSGVLVAEDTVYSIYGPKVLQTKPYFLTSVSSSTGGSNDVGVTQTVVDVMGRSVQVASADPHGSASVMFGGATPGSYGSYGSRTAALTQLTYSGQTTKTTNDHGQTKTEEHFASGDISRVTDANGAQLALLYDGFGKLSLTRDALQNTTRLIYDFQGRETEIDDPDRGTVTFSYDGIGNLVAQQSAAQKANGVSTVMSYDVLDRLVTRTEAESIANWYFDAYKGQGGPMGAVCTRGAGRLCETTTSTGIDRRNIFDSLGRLIGRRVDTGTGTPSFTFATGYDVTSGRISSVTYPTGLQVVSNYTARGFLQSMALAGTITASIASLPGTQSQTSSTLSPGQVLWQADAMNAEGEFESETGATGIVNRSTYEPATGRIVSLSSGSGAASNVVNETYGWDSLGNLTSRGDANGDGTTALPTSGAVSEAFGYDGVNRLQNYTVSAPGVPGTSRNVTLSYNALGSILYKSDVGIFAYGAAGGAHPHMPVSLANSVFTSFTPDASGNVVTATGGKYQNMSYTGFDMISSASNAGSTVQYTWMYDENRRRLKETHTSAGNTRTLWYMNPDSAGGLEFEYESNTATSPLYSARHYVNANGRTVAVLATGSLLPVLPATQLTPPVITNIALNKLETWHKDHLGSIVATTDHQGRVTERYAFDPYGKRRYSYGAYDATGVLVFDWNPAANFGTGRGFTGHEQLDDIGITNMNGRLFDPNMGMFIQADPEITNPHNLQSYNRYSYTLNNPLNATDPTGFENFGTDTWKTDADPLGYNPMDSNGISQFALYGNDLNGFSGGTTSGSTASSADTGVQNNSNQGDPGTQTFGQSPSNPNAAPDESKPEPPPKPDVPTTCQEPCNRARQMNDAAVDQTQKADQGIRDSVEVKAEASAEVKVNGKSHEKSVEVTLKEGHKDKYADPTGKASLGVDKKLLSLKTPEGSKIEASVKIEVKAKVDLVQLFFDTVKLAAGAFVQATLAGASTPVAQTSSAQLQHQMDDAEAQALGGGPK